MECSAGNAVNLTFLWSDPLQVHLQRKNPGGVAFTRQGYAQPPAILSFNRPQTPLGSAAVMAMPAIIGLASTLPHSSAVKFAFVATGRLRLP